MVGKNSFMYPADNRDLKLKRPFAPAGQSTQMIIGATDETDLELIRTTQSLYQSFDLKRVFYSGYIPLNEDDNLPQIGTPVPLLREHRLYQADWLLRYYGFYIAKYEASEIKINEKETIASKKDVIPLSNINYNIAYEKAQKMYQIYNYSDSKTALINSYAWDTTLKWIDNNVTNYSKNISYGNYSGIINLTGNTDTDIVNNICDLSGNLREWTTEIYYVENDISVLEEKDVYRVIRGGSANIEKAASSHIVYPDTMTDTYWGFRVVLYKK